MTINKNISYIKRFLLNPILGLKSIKIIPNTNNLFSLARVIYDSFLFGKKYERELKIRVGDTAPLFELPNAVGEKLKLEDFLKNNQVVLIFYRGDWCPFCNLWLREFQKYLIDFEKENAIIIAISPQIPNDSLSIKEKLDLKFQVLSDVGNKIAKKYTNILTYEGKSAEALKNIGVNLNEYNLDETGEVPIPAVFVIGLDSKVYFAQSEGGDYKKRVDPRNVLVVLRAERL